MTMLNLTQEYDYAPPDISFLKVGQFLKSNFLTRDRVHEASLWWGETLMSKYWVEVGSQMDQICQDQLGPG